MNKTRFLALALVALMAITPLAVQAIGDDNNPPAAQPAQPENPPAPAPAPKMGRSLDRLNEETRRLQEDFDRRMARIAAARAELEAMDPLIAALEAKIAEAKAALTSETGTSETQAAKLAEAKAAQDKLAEGLDKVAEANVAVETAISEIGELQERALEELEATKGSYEELLGTDESEGTAPEDSETDNPPTEPSGTDGK